MLDHIGLRVQDFAKALEFYRSALSPIGYEVVMEFPDAAGLGEKGKPDFWLMKGEPSSNPSHIAFVSDRESVDAFHIAAIAAGGTDNGAPGLRLDYHPHYYAAFVRDPEGNNIEVVCHTPPGQKRMAARSPAKAAAKASKKKAPARKAAKAKAKPKAAAGKKRGKKKR
jgi:catechol 2,3-dioxygenase-like lactoylglutathione lyase family enzyme